MEENISVYISMTTIPSRFKFLVETVEKLLCQTMKPQKIIINIPKKYRRFPNIEYNIPQELLDNHDVIVNIIDEDYGPITKILPALSIVQNSDDLIVIVDDDVEYPNNLIEELYRNSKDRSFECVVGLSGLNILRKGMDIIRTKRHLKKIKILEGFAGVMFVRGMFKDDFVDYVKCVTQNDHCFRCDDLIIHNYLDKYEKIIINDEKISIRKIKINQLDDPLSNFGTIETVKNAILFLKPNNLWYLK